MITKTIAKYEKKTRGFGQIHTWPLWAYQLSKTCIFDMQWRNMKGHESKMKGNEGTMKRNKCNMKRTWEELDAKWKPIKGNENKRWHLLTLDQGCFYTHRQLEKSHFLPTGSSPPEKTIRVKKKNDNEILGNSKRYVFFFFLNTTPHIQERCPQILSWAQMA